MSAGVTVLSWMGGGIHVVKMDESGHASSGKVDLNG
jgi:hypothetical protein